MAWRQDDLEFLTNCHKKWKKAQIIRKVIVFCTIKDITKSTSGWQIENILNSFITYLFSTCMCICACVCICAMHVCVCVSVSWHGWVCVCHGMGECVMCVWVCTHLYVHPCHASQSRTLRSWFFPLSHGPGDWVKALSLGSMHFHPLSHCAHLGFVMYFKQ